MGIDDPTAPTALPDAAAAPARPGAGCPRPDRRVTDRRWERRQPLGTAVAVWLAALFGGLAGSLLLGADPSPPPTAGAGAREPAVSTTVPSPSTSTTASTSVASAAVPVAATAPRDPVVASPSPPGPARGPGHGAGRHGGRGEGPNDAPGPAPGHGGARGPERGGHG
jgi:hypothetical protein